MSYTLLLVHVPAGASEDEVEKIALATTEAEERRLPAPLDPEKERQKQALVTALVTGCPELEGAAPDSAALARAENISEEDARHRFHWWTVSGPEEGAGIVITLYDDYVSLDLSSAAGTDEDWEDVWRYLEILVREGGFVVWDPQGPNLVDLAAGPFGDGRRITRQEPVSPRRRRKTRRSKRDADRDIQTSRGGATDVDESDSEDENDPDVEREDVRRGGEIARLINRIVNEAIAEPLAAVGFTRSGRTWRRVLDNGLIHVVNVQWSPRAGGVEGTFSLNAGVYSGELAESIALYPVTSSPKEYDCQVRLRAGPPGRHSWQVRVPGIAKPDPDVTGLFAQVFGWLDRRADSKAAGQQEKATRELREALERYVFPALERMRTFRGVRDELAKSPDLFWAAHASLLLGERDEAERLVQRALEKAKRNPEFSEKIREWGRRNGLMVDTRT